MKAFFHFCKYFLLVIFILAVFNFVRSNFNTTIPLTFSVPALFTWEFLSVSVIYLLTLGFCLGILCAALLGALRIQKLHNDRKELKELKKKLESSAPLPGLHPNLNQDPDNEELPSLADH